MTDFSYVEGAPKLRKHIQDTIARVPPSKMPRGRQTSTKYCCGFYCDAVRAPGMGSPHSAARQSFSRFRAVLLLLLAVASGLSLPSHLRPEVSCYVLGRLSKRKERSRGIVAHDLLQLVDLFRDVAKSCLWQKRERADGK